MDTKESSFSKTMKILAFASKGSHVVKKQRAMKDKMVAISRDIMYWTFEGEVK